MVRKRRIGEILLEEKAISLAQLNLSLERMKFTKLRLGEQLVKLRICTEADIVRALSKQLKIPVVELDSVNFDPDVFSIVTRSLAVECNCVPFKVEGEYLHVTFADPLRLDLVQHLEAKTQRKVKKYISTQSEVEQAIEKHYKEDDAAREIMDNLDDTDEFYLEGMQSKEQEAQQQYSSEQEDVETADLPASELLDASKDKGVVTTVNQIIKIAVGNDATDIHFEPQRRTLLVRQRIDGILQELTRLPRSVASPVIARVKSLAGLDVAETTVPQDGKVAAKVKDDETLDLRVNTMPTRFGEKVVVQILTNQMAEVSLERIFVDPEQQESVRELLKANEGLVVVCGPAGSGRTTTLYSLLKELRSPERSLVSIEDPIAFELDGVNQVQVNRRIGLNFEKVLRSLLRQNPDAVLVGDIPDSRTATVVANAARDRLVLASMTNLNAVHCAEKLAGLAMDRSELASILKAIISQRLVRKLCPKCKESYEPDAAEVSPFGLNPGISLYKGKGCDNCNYSGYKGRIALAQVLVASEGLREALKSGADVEKINAAAIEEGLASLAEAGGKLLKKELTTTEELRRVIGEESSSGTVLRPKALVKPFSSGEKPLKEVEKVLRPLRRSQEPRQDGEERKCPECSEKVKGGWKICPYCGKSLLEKPEPFVCPSCDEKVDGKWNLCPNCGADLKAGREREAQESPVSSADEPALSNERPKIEGHPRVLVVDDQRSMQKLVSIALKGIDCEVFTAADGIEALEKVKRVKPHLIILDIVMPRMDGLEVCRRLRADVRTAFIPIIMLTSLSDKKSRLKGYVAGTDDYLAKPFMMEEFYTRVHNLLRRTYGYQSDHDDLVDVGNEWDSATEDYRKEQKIRDLQEHQRMLEQEKHEDGMET